MAGNLAIADALERADPLNLSNTIGRPYQNYRDYALELQGKKDEAIRTYEQAPP